jgi:hypothetical protein
MPTYIVETFLPGGAAAERLAQERRARSAAEGRTRAGTRVTFDGSIHVPEDEICFYRFDAPSARDAAEVAHNAGLQALRVVEAFSSPQIHVDHPSQSASDRPSAGSSKEFQ